MKVAVIGSRSIKKFDLGKYLPEETKFIISGGAVGVDTVAAPAASQHLNGRFPPCLLP